ncbi:Tpk1p [Rhizophagus irregularis DAOM 197198w]|uniref:Tpk1p n=1 Tax=Rhizophagus irregularis (strain DAOM 197198w) TaxID=1432141 RepID=A0A015KWK2_RHIIW|nr:Tpk1p [Rhizophagus irregularis DAOM 197198w]
MSPLIKKIIKGGKKLLDNLRKKFKKSSSSHESQEMCEICNDFDCNVKYFKRNFKNWMSGNNDIDLFIQNTQLSAHYNVDDILEWIPYDKFYNIEYISKGGFGEVYKANWIDGIINKWDDKIKNWKRKDKNKIFALKRLNDSKNVKSEFINEIASHYKVNSNSNIIKLYGITQDPKTEHYLMILEYAENGNLRNYLIKNNKLNWENKISFLNDIAIGLEYIHEKEINHQNLHTGNLLYMDDIRICITDIGLCKPDDTNNNNVYGVLPYIAPEILQGQNYTNAADIYSYGIIMYEVISGLPPFYDVCHDENLAIKICNGHRPRFSIKVPQLIVQLIKRCLDSNPSNRPTIKEITRIISQWLDGWNCLDLRKQLSELGENNDSSNTILTFSYSIHSDAIYTSRLFNFNNLPAPKNFDNYYEKNDDIITMDDSGFIPIDTIDNYSQLDISVTYCP